MAVKLTLSSSEAIGAMGCGGGEGVNCRGSKSGERIG